MQFNIDGLKHPKNTSMAEVQSSFLTLGTKTE